MAAQGTFAGLALVSALPKLSTAHPGGGSSSSFHLLYPGLSASAPGASQSRDWDSDGSSWVSRGFSKSLLQCCPLQPVFSPHHTCSLSLQTPDGAGADGGGAWPLQGHLLLALVAALASLLPGPQTEPLPSQAFLHLTHHCPRLPQPHHQPSAPSAPAGRSPREAAALKEPLCPSTARWPWPSSSQGVLHHQLHRLLRPVLQGRGGVGFLGACWACSASWLPDPPVFPGPLVELFPHSWGQTKAHLGKLRQRGAWAPLYFREEWELSPGTVSPEESPCSPSGQVRKQLEQDSGESPRLGGGSFQFLIRQMHAMIPHLPDSFSGVRLQ